MSILIRVRSYLHITTLCYLPLIVLQKPNEHFVMWILYLKVAVAYPRQYRTCYPGFVRQYKLMSLQKDVHIKAGLCRLIVYLRFFEAINPLLKPVQLQIL